MSSKAEVLAINSGGPTRSETILRKIASKCEVNEEESLNIPRKLNLGTNRGKRLPKPHRTTQKGPTVSPRKSESFLKHREDGKKGDVRGSYSRSSSLNISLVRLNNLRLAAPSGAFRRDGRGLR